MTQRPRETYYRRDQTRQRCARRRATARSNAHVDALARDLDVMASATALFFSPASSVAVLGAALAPGGTDFVEVSSRAPGCDSEPRPPPTKIPAVPGAVRCGL